MGSGEWGVGSGEWEVGHRSQRSYSSIPTPHSLLPTPRFENDAGHLRARAAGLVAQAVFAAMLQVQERQPQIQRVKRHKAIFVQIVNRSGLGEVQRTEIDFPLSVFRLDQQRQALSPADQRTRFVDRATIIKEQRACYRLALGFAFYDLASLLFHTSANWSGQRFNRSARLFGLDGEHGNVVMATSAASSAADQMLRVTRLKLRGKFDPPVL